MHRTSSLVGGSGATPTSRSGPGSKAIQSRSQACPLGPSSHSTRTSHPCHPVPLPFFSFTGSKGSMLGDLHFYGKAGVTFFTRPKTITSNWNPLTTAGTADKAHVVMPTLGK